MAAGTQAAGGSDRVTAAVKHETCPSVLAAAAAAAVVLLIILSSLSFSVAKSL